MLSRCATEMGVRGQEVPTPLVCARLEQSPPYLTKSEPEVMHESLKVHLSPQIQGDFTEPGTVPSSGSTFIRCVSLSPFTMRKQAQRMERGWPCPGELGSWDTQCMSAAGVGDTAETSQLFG